MEVNEDDLNEFISNLNDNSIISKNVFDLLFSIIDPIEHERVLMKLENRAEKLKCLTNFKNVYKKISKERSSSNSINSMKLPDIIDELEKNNTFIYYNDDIYFYNDKIYSNDIEQIEKMILDIDNNSNEKKRKDVIKNYKLVLLGQFEERKIEMNKNYIAFKNGLYNLNTKELEPFNKDVYVFNMINTEYIIQNKPINEVDEFLDDISCNNIDRKKAILEMIGYCMINSTELEKSFILYGQSGGNGKSTLTDIIRTIIGEENTSIVSLKELSNNKFVIVELKGKLVNIATEMSNDDIKDVDIFKRIVTGNDVIKGETKFVQKRDTFKSYAKNIFSANELPTIPNDNGFYRRLHVIPFERTFTNEEKRNFRQKEKIIKSKTGIEYLTYIALKSYEEMMTNNRMFSNEEESDKIVDQFKIENDNVRSFIKEYHNLEDLFNLDETYKRLMGYEIIKGIPHIKKSCLYSEYESFCNNNGYKKKGKNKFLRQIMNENIINERTYNGIDYIYLVDNVN